MFLFKLFFFFFACFSFLASGFCSSLVLKKRKSPDESKDAAISAEGGRGAAGRWVGVLRGKAIGEGRLGVWRKKYLKKRGKEMTLLIVLWILMMRSCFFLLDC